MRVATICRGRVGIVNVRRPTAARCRPLCIALVLAAGSFPSFGQEAGGSGLHMATGLNTSLTLTDNLNLSSVDRQSALYLTAAPWISVFGQSGALRGSLNYSLSASFYSSDSNPTFYNFLSAQGTAELVRSQAYVDATASISRQQISPFGTQSGSPTLINSNSTQVSSLSVSPRVNGQIAGQVDYIGRAYFSATSSGTSLAPDSSEWGGILSFNGSSRWNQLRWGLNFSYREFNFSEQRSTFDQLYWASLNYAPIPDLILSLRANQETSNLVSLNSEVHYGYGGGVRWTPSPRTELIAEYDTRVFGSSHLYAFNYRTARTVWSISSTQGLSNGQGTSGLGGIYGNTTASPTTAFEQMFAVFASIQPDPILRTQLVNDYLRARGIDPNASLVPNYLPSQMSEQLSNNASVAWMGLRDTVMLSVNRTQTTDLGPLSNPGNNFANGQPVTWQGFSVSWSHRLTPLQMLTVTGTQQRTTGTESTNFWTGTAMWTNQWAPRVSSSLAATYSAQGGASSYTATSLIATLNMQF